MEITAEEKNILGQIYGKFVSSSGYSQNHIEEVRELTAEERRFFERKNFISPNFCVQTLYKVTGKISPMNFNRVVKNLVVEDENFRANFCNVGSRTLKIIFANRDIISEMVFRVLELDADELDETLIKIMEADRRLNFDIQRGSLIRFSIFRTAENEAAVLVTLSQLISSRFNSEDFFSAVFKNIPYKKFEPRPTLKVPQLENRVKEYWTDILKNLPAPAKVPFTKKNSGSYNEEIYRFKIPANILSDLREKAQNNRAMLMTILQTAWGFLLQAANKNSDVVFCQLTEKKGLLNLIPVRLKNSQDTLLENIVTQQFKQLVVSQPYSFFDWATLENLTSRRTNLFDHFLSFLDFSAEEKTFSQVAAAPEGKIVERNSWDAQGMQLGVYFQYANTNVAISFRYDKNQFFQNTGENLAKIYNLILRQMLVYWHAPFSKFLANIGKIAAAITDAAETPSKDERKIIVDFIYKNKILQTESTGAIQMLIDNAKIFMQFEGDRIFGDILEKNLIFVVEGKLARSLDAGDGWFKALDIIKAGGWINETVFLQERRAAISAEVLTEKAVLMTIPLTTFESAALQNPALYKSCLRQISSQMEKYQVLWLQS